MLNIISTNLFMNEVIRKTQPEKINQMKQSDKTNQMK